MKRVTEQIMYRKESEVDDILSKNITDCYLLIFRKFHATVTDNLHSLNASINSLASLLWSEDQFILVEYKYGTKQEVIY